MIQFIDIYCERTALGLMNEPLNVLTNISFFLAAWFSFRAALEHKLIAVDVNILLVLLIAIGTGSTLFHMFATPLTMAMDSVPILLFQIVFLSLYCSRVANISHGYVSAVLLTFFLTVFIFGSLPAEFMNGSAGYLPALIFLLGLGCYHKWKKKNEPYILLLAALVFSVSLGFRTLDINICSAFPVGTHFLWHCLNGVVLYLSVRAYILNRGALASR
jgi:hypothetical protein